MSSKTQPLTFYVSTAGNDAWSGRTAAPAASGHDGPFATLAGARDAIRALKAKRGLPPGGVMVRVRRGTYRLEQGLAFGSQDSGEPGAPIEYRACKGETVRLLGGRRLDPAAFTPVTDPAVHARLAPAAREHVVQVDLRAQGLTDFGAFASRGFNRKTVPAHLELFFNDQPMTVAQWPDAGQFLGITGYTKPKNDEWGSETGELTGGFTYAGDRPKGWAPSDNIWVHGYWAYDWANSYERVRRLDPEARVVETADPHGLYYFRKNQRFYFLNVLEELDQPGEYCVDREAGVLYFWPPSRLAGADVLVSELAEPLVSFDETSHVTLADFTLEAGRGCGVQATGGTALRIAGCLLRNLGTWAVKLEGGTNHTVAGCEICGTGDGGISLSGGDRATLTPCRHAVLNNHLHHFARWSRCYVAGVGANGVGIRIAHNLFHDAPHNAILFWGNDFTIENNEIYRVCLETGDAGAIYTGRDFTFRGNVIRRNFIHHMGGVGMGSIAIYMDDCVSGTHIAENILQDCQYGLMLGGGRDFVVENNVLVDCHPAIHADARGVDPNPVWQNMVNNTMKKSLEAMRHHQPPYSKRYPEIADVDPFYATGKGVPPGNIRVERNLCCGGRWIDPCWPKGAGNGVTERDNVVGGDPGFVAPEFGDFRLRPDSPAWACGFKAIPLDEIGPVRDADRARVPPHVRAALVLAAAPPGVGEPIRLRLLLRNDGDTEARGTAVVACSGTAAVVVVEPAEDRRPQEGSPRVEAGHPVGPAVPGGIVFAVPPGATQEHPVVVNAAPGLLTVRVTSPDTWLHPARLEVVVPHAMPRLAALAGLEAVPAALAGVAPLPFVEQGTVAGELRLALAGEFLAVHLGVADARIRAGLPTWTQGNNPWTNPAFGLLIDAPEGAVIRQVVFFPDGTGRGEVWRFTGPEREAPADFAWQTTLRGPGTYELTALIPASLLGLGVGAPGFRLQGMLGTQTASGTVGVVPLFGSAVSPTDSRPFGVCRVEPGA